MANSIDFVKNYTTILDEVYQRAGVSNVLNGGRRMVRAGRNAKEVMIPRISVLGLGDYTRNEGYKAGSITYEFETEAFNYDRGIRLFADVMEEASVLDCLVEAGSELQRTQVAPPLPVRIRHLGHFGCGDALVWAGARAGARRVRPGHPGHAGAIASTRTGTALWCAGSICPDV